MASYFTKDQAEEIERRIGLAISIQSDDNRDADERGQVYGR